MISEPELVGGPAFPDAGPPPYFAQEPGRPRTPRARRPWLWALGGAVVASAVWAGGLYAYGHARDAGPDLGGYRTDRDPCKAAKLEGLTSAIGPRDTGDRAVHQEPYKVEQPAYFSWSCSVYLKSGNIPYEVSIDYRLHRVTDPRPEFEALRADPGGLGGGDWIAGLGDMAYAGGPLGDTSLEVLDGQAELSFNVRAEELDEHGIPRDNVPKLDPAAMRTYLVEDMRQLMAALKK
ncbi:hypothetical protein [Streptomyces sp. NPDC004788]